MSRALPVPPGWAPMYWPPESYKRINYDYITIDFSKEKPPYTIQGPADYLDVYDSDVDLGSVYISLNGGPLVPLKAVLPIRSPFERAVIVWNTSVISSGQMKLILGREFFRPSRQTIVIDTTKLFTNVNNKVSVAAANNTAGVEATLFVDYRSTVEVYVNTSGAADIEVYGSLDASEWFKTFTTSISGGEWSRVFQNGFPWVKVRVPTTGIDVTIVITANV